MIAVPFPAGVQELPSSERTALTYFIACDLARCLSRHWGITERDVYAELVTVPDEMLGLLNTPFGQSAVSEYIRSASGIDAPAYVPVIH